MLAIGTSGNNSALSEWLKLRPKPVAASCMGIVFAIFICILPYAAPAQPAQSSISAYADAIKQSTISDRITAMDKYLALAGNSRLKVDALEFLVWDHLRLGHQAQSAQRARELLAISPGNPIAIAVLSQDAPSAPQGRAAVQNQVATLTAVRSGVDHMIKPEGMLDRNFQMLQQQVAIMLNGAIGMAYLALQDYPRARPALEQAVASDPNNPQWVYGMGLALLNGKERDQYRGYWYLARAANLTGGTAQGQEIARYARETYHKDGGKDPGWDRFLASAAALDAPPSPDTGRPMPASNAVVASNRSAPSNGNSRTGTPAEATRSARNDVPGTTTTSSAHSGRNKKVTIGFEDTLRGPPTSPEPVASAPANRPRVMAPPSEAVSLGILIETSLLTNRNRPAIIATLKDIVRNLRSNDEACILVFSNQLDFEQDLTADDKLLEEAISQIRPKQGKALLSGIAFAAGHLKRIGRNSNRILLVISDGRDTQSATSDTLAFRSQVTGVRIDCLGLEADGVNERALLERVAAYSGGKASFASDSGQFRTAALQITRNMGIAVP
ncbi:MAG TPA: VWA domain-containing protein [Candidatus Angelobacter sp.]|jgi:tetratricopeptide (TPR) repeat protein|nr:VWA domain-containing protein [Candidatus Angelobacter sp.]